MRRLMLATSVLALAVGGLTYAPTEPASAVPPGFTHTTYTSGLDTPTAFALAPDGRIFVTEKGGAIRVVLPDGTLVPQPFATLAVDVASEKGALGIAVHPDFATNQWIYVYWSVGGAHRLSRFTASGNQAVEAREDLVQFDPHPAPNHNGGAVHFGPDGKVYVATGDNAQGTNAQTLANRHGKILRYNDDGSIPTDNPFGADSPIYALGLRNPYTFAFGPCGVAHVNDVGSGGGAREEINLLVAGGNYGWPGAEGQAPPGYDPPGPGVYRNPLFDYGHTAGELAITGGTFYTGTAFPQEYQGDYFFADYGGGWIDQLDPSGAVTRFEANAGSPVDLLSHPDGSLLYLDIGGTIGRISFPASAAVATKNFEPLAPTRVVDTRQELGGCRLAAGETLEVPVGPPGATAVAVNLTADRASGDGYLTAWPCGQAAPATSTLNYVAGVPGAAGALVGLGGGKLCVRAYTDADVVLDVFGWLGPGGGSGLVPVENVRLHDTRSGPPLGAGATTVVSTGSLGAGTAVAVNLTGTETAADGFLTAWPCDQPRPVVSNLNVRAGETRANLAIVPLAADGTFCVYSYGGGHVVVDAVGVFTSGAGTAFEPVAPSRLLDTRAGAPVAAGTSVEIATPAGALAVALSVVATEGAGEGYLTVYPCGEDPPLASTVNHLVGQTIANGAVARVGVNGRVCVFAYATTHVVVDLTGVFT